MIEAFKKGMGEMLCIGETHMKECGVWECGNNGRFLWEGTDGGAAWAG